MREHTSFATQCVRVEFEGRSKCGGALFMQMRMQVCTEVPMMYFCHLESEDAQQLFRVLLMRVPTYEHNLGKLQLIWHIICVKPSWAFKPTSTPHPTSVQQPVYA